MTNNIISPINNFPIFSDPETEDNIKELYRGWLMSDLSDSASSYHRSAMYYLLEQLLEITETFKE